MSDEAIIAEAALREREWGAFVRAFPTVAACNVVQLVEQFFRIGVGLEGARDGNEFAVRMSLARAQIIAHTHRIELARELGCVDRAPDTFYEFLLECAKDFAAEMARRFPGRSMYSRFVSNSIGRGVPAVRDDFVDNVDARNAFLGILTLHANPHGVAIMDSDTAGQCLYPAVHGVRTRCPAEVRPCLTSAQCERCRILKLHCRSFLGAKECFECLLTGTRCDRFVSKPLLRVQEAREDAYGWADTLAAVSLDWNYAPHVWTLYPGSPHPSMPDLVDIDEENEAEGEAEGNRAENPGPVESGAGAP